MLELVNRGATAIPSVLQKNEIKILLDDSKGFTFTPREESTDTNVAQHFSGYDPSLKDSAYMALARKTEIFLRTIFFGISEPPIHFNDYSLQKYPVSKPEYTFAISPHRDHKYCINLIAIYVLKGKAPFCVCANKSAKNAVEIKSKPGDLILMRGFGFLDSNFRPVHFLGKVSEERLSFGLRQVTEGKSLPKF